MEGRKEGWTCFFPLQFEIKTNIKNIFNFSPENFVNNITELVPLILHSVESGEMFGSAVELGFPAAHVKRGYSAGA
jgi:hypothetical protein